MGMWPTHTYKVYKLPSTATRGWQCGAFTHCSAKKRRQETQSFSHSICSVNCFVFSLTKLCKQVKKGALTSG